VRVQKYEVGKLDFEVVALVTTRYIPFLNRKVAAHIPEVSRLEVVVENKSK
jgi:hypothetical protein